MENDYIYDDITGEFISKRKLLEVYHSRSSETLSDYGKIRKDLSDIKSDLKSLMPFVITEVQIGNVYKGSAVETDYGGSIYSNNTMYLSPKIFYRGFLAGSYSLKTKWYRPDGTLSRGDTSPSDCSQINNYFLSEGRGVKILTGWGNEDKGYWGKGDYRFEIWYNNRCVFVKHFKIF